MGVGRRSWVIDAVEGLKATPGKWVLVKTYDEFNQSAWLRARFKSLGAQAKAIRAESGKVELHAVWPEPTGRVPRV